MFKKENMGKFLAVLLIASSVSVFSGGMASASCNTSTDRYGNTTGTIGSSRVNTSTDRYGNQTGSIGSTRVNCSTDRYGNKHC